MKYYYICGGGWYNSSTYTSTTDRVFTSVPFNGIYGANWYLNARDCRISFHSAVGPGHSFGLSFRLIKRLKS